MTRILAAVVGVVLLAMGPAGASPAENIKVAFRKFVVAQNQHDLRAMAALLSDSPDFIWIASGNVARGRDAALKRYEALFADKWNIRPDWTTYQSMMLDVSTTEVFVRAAKESQRQPASMNFVLVNTPSGWRVLSIVEGGS